MPSHSDSALLIEDDTPHDLDESASLKSYPPSPLYRKKERFVPAVPKTLADTGLPSSLIEQLILKFLYFKGEIMGGDLSRAIGLRFSSIEAMIDGLKQQQFVQVKSSLGYGPVSSVLSLTDLGRRVSRDYLETNQYVGPAPVPISQYRVAVEQQRLAANWLTLDRLRDAYAHMVVNEQMLNQVGPAVAAGKTFLIYGQPGNGKTQVAEALSHIQTSGIYIPYAIECQGNIIQLYDPIYHKLIDRKGADADPDFDFDGRWGWCKRPFIASGGELSLSMLDLSYNLVSKIYDAPFQLKANNGIYLIDDFGRQKATSAEILNRWIVPMERRVDYLSFTNGGKMTVPFETFLIFSTNLTPELLGDEAFLRRIQYKMLLRSPGEDEFRTIFRAYCESQGLSISEQLIDNFVDKHYHLTGKQFRRCHPRDVISQVIDYIHFKRLPYEISEDLLDQAFCSCFPATGDLSET